ncbi:dioxygenase [Rhizobacter sp. Root1221]|uniref:dioxygenase family protein n=1 Tax=Rhizobacter sp. Root1221 TaxID=1736433 RepID=UPI0006FC3D27|nr:class III extradiol ring-cleavage dioxygenase [Rhizobacter sp. Root1221]KQV78738.1 extradiol ring-cleavage dioxygenase [Rhizobacter sp. Root1221]
MNTLPPLFLSHGSPMLALEPGATGAFASALGAAIDRTFGRPQAVLAVSAHSTARAPVLLAAARQHAVHDFGGFPEPLYALRYDAPGAPGLAPAVAALLGAAGEQPHVVGQGGLDHGIWSMLRFMYPDADVPVLPLAWMPHQSPERQFAFGQALAALSAQGVLVMGSGSITHNLRRVFASGRAEVDAEEVPESRQFRDWFAARSAGRDWPALWDYRRQAPFAADMHPTDEHLLPWFVAAGAGGEAEAPVRLFDAVTYGCLGMDAYAFGPAAPALAAAL